MEIRELYPHERDGAVALLAVQMVEHNIEIDDETLGRAIEGALADPRLARFLVAADGDRLVGIAYLSFQWTLEYGGRIAWLEELYVVPEHREKGLGSRLLDAALEAVRASGCLAVDLEIERGHERAANLYERTGFTKLSRVRWSKRL
jgi:GNAT superfamily N-acetyltransferase